MRKLSLDIPRLVNYNIHKLLNKRQKPHDSYKTLFTCFRIFSIQRSTQIVNSRDIQENGGDIMAFAENVKRLREEKGLTQAELANMIEVAQPTVAQYEKGMKVPTIITGVILAKVLGTTCEKLVD